MACQARRRSAAGVAARRAVDDRAADGGGPAARRGAELPDPAERIPADRFHRHLRHRVGLADDPPGPGRHAPAHGPRARSPRWFPVPCGHSRRRRRSYSCCSSSWCSAISGHPPGPVGRGYLDRRAGDRLPALGQAEGRCRAWRASGPGRAVRNRRRPEPPANNNDRGRSPGAARRFSNCLSQSCIWSVEPCDTRSRC